MLQPNINELEMVVAEAVDGYKYLQQLSRKDRASLMGAIASKIESLGEELIQVAHQETNLPFARLMAKRPELFINGVYMLM